MHPFTSTYIVLVFVPSSTMVAGTHNVFALDSYSAFAVLQSRLHEIWVRFFSSSMEDRIRYTPTDGFETFPFPIRFKTTPDLDRIGKEYYEQRSSVMMKNTQGLTETYNRFHDPEERDPEIVRLRKLHAAMDRAVFVAYGWTNIQPTYEFLLDFEDAED